MSACRWNLASLIAVIVLLSPAARAEGIEAVATDQCQAFQDGLAEGIRVFSTDHARARSAFARALERARCAKAPPADVLEIQLWLCRNAMFGGSVLRERAHRLFAQAIDESRRALGDHTRTGDLLMAWAQAFELERKPAEALPLAEQALAIRRREAIALLRPLSPATTRTSTTP